MARIYTNTNKIKFTHIPDKYDVVKSLKGAISIKHSAVVTYVCAHFTNTRKYKQQIVDVLNIVTYHFYAGEIPPNEWKMSSPFTNVPEIDSDELENTLQDVYLTVDGIEWDVKETYDSQNNVAEISSEVKSMEKLSTPHTTVRSVVSLNSPKSASKKKVTKAKTSEVVISPTPKQDLYIQPPTVPLFDYNKPWMKGKDGADNLVIYTTLPEIPRKQNEISVTTDVTKMTRDELMNLYPNRIIHTRASVMYEHLEGVELDPDLGLIIPIEGFTREQIIDNIIRYPHIFQLKREVEGRFCSLYSHIEIDGELKGTLDVWDTLPESKILPRQAEFIKEYVVRRYLLERDISHIQHKYPIFGNFDEFLTLFMPSDNYIYRGYSNVEEIVKKCVLSRVAYKQSRNPVIRRLIENA